MDKSNVFRSSNFYMSDGDVLHIIIKDNTGDSLVVALTGTENGVDVTEDSNYTSTVNMTDADGNIYGAVTIGTQMWMLQNLKTTKYNDGTAIPNITGYNDWHMPSEDELNYMFINLHSGIDQYLTVYAPVGGFANDSYWSSSEVNATQARAISFFNSSHLYDNKSDTHYVRACRAFTSSTVYALRDTGPSGGLIFYKNGDNYLEADAADASAAHTWSNIDALLVGTDTAIGTGKANSDAIIAQVGHTDSAAKLCEDLSGSAAWVADITGAYCWYDNDSANKDIYGALYNSYATDNAHGLAPTDWRIPTWNDFNILASYLGSTVTSGGALKETGTDHWLSPNTGATNISGFRGVGAGRRNYLGSFIELNSYLNLWTSIDGAVGYTYIYFLEAASTVLYPSEELNSNGFSVRCVRDL